MNALPLSVVINTKNAAATLERTLESVKDAAEIVIVDMHSSDETLAIAHRFTGKIYEHADLGYVEPARNFAVQQATQDWILVLDADEVVPESLWQELPSLLADRTVSCYELPRKNLVFGKWIERAGWWPDFQKRLFQQKKVKWSDAIHQPPVVEGSVKTLPAEERFAITHYNYTSIAQYLEKLNSYTAITAAEKPLATGSTVTPKTVISAFYSQLMSRLFAQKGIDDGVHGVALSHLQSMYELVIELKRWEAMGSVSTQNDQAETVASLQQMRRELAYWIADWQVGQAKGLAQLYWKVRRKLRL